MRYKPLALIIGLLIVVAISVDVEAYAVQSRTWLSAIQTYKRTSGYNNAGANFTNRANEAAAEWTADTVFSLSHNSGSVNTLDYKTPDAPYQDALGVTYWYFDGPYRTRAETVINNTKPWHALTGNPPAEFYDLESILVHEFGHFIGLGHDDGTGVMRATFAPGVKVDQVNNDDKNGVKYLYESGYNSTHPVEIGSWWVGYGAYDNTTKFVLHKGTNWIESISSPYLARDNSLSWSNALGAVSGLGFVSVN